MVCSKEASSSKYSELGVALWQSGVATGWLYYYGSADL